MTEIFSPVVAVFLAGVLAMAAAQKLMQRPRMARAAAKLSGTTPPVGDVVSLSAAVIEVLAAAALLSGDGRMAGALAAAALWLVYTAALFAARIRGAAPFDCGCTLRAQAATVDMAAIARPFLLAAFALGLAALPAARIDVAAVFAALAFLALVFAAGELAALPSPQRSRS